MAVARKCTLRILDQVNCIFTGIHPDHIAYFFEEYSAFAPNYYFNPKFKLGSWDGKIRYFHKTGKTYVNLLEDILPRLAGLGYTLTFIDDRCTVPLKHPELITESYFSHVVDEESGTPWFMRQYQVDMVNALIANGGGVGVAGTGAGKTSMCAALAKSYEVSGGYRSIIIVPDKNLNDQTFEEYASFGVDVGQYSGETKDIDHNHVVSTWQSLQNNPKLIQDFDVIIVDEAHGLRGQVLTKLLVEYAKDVPFRFGVTGTLPKAETDAMAVRIAVGTVQYTIPAHVLQAEGYLAKLHIDVLQLNDNFKPEFEEWKEEYLESWQAENPGHTMTYTKFKDSYFPDYASEKRFLQSKAERLEWIADYISIKREEKQGNVFCLVNGIAFGKKLSKLVEGSVFLHGTDKMAVRKEAYDTFKDNDNVVVFATVNIASTGLNIKRIFNLMFIDMGKSFIRTIQTIGRGLRKAPDKDSVHVTDICSDLKYSKKHLRERTKYYKEAHYKFKKHLVDYNKE